VVKRDSWLEEEWVSMQKKQRLVAEKKNKRISLEKAGKEASLEEGRVHLISRRGEARRA
jgi:hypothetical protein